MAAGLTILWGTGLYWHDFHATGRLSPGALVYALGGVIALAAAIFGGSVTSPTARHPGELGAAVRAAGGPPPHETVASMERLQRRLRRVTELNTTLLVLAAATMAVARHVN